MRKLHGSNMHPGLNAAVSRALDSSDGKVGLQTVCPPGASGMMSSVPENEMTDAQSAGGAGGANLSQQFQSTFSDGLGEQLQQDLVSQMLADPGLAKRVRWEELPVSSQQLLKSEVAQLNCKAVSALGDGARVYVREPKQALRTMTSALLCPDAVPQNTPRKTVWSTSSSSKATTTVSAMLQDAEIAASGSIASSFDPTHVPPSSLVQAVTVPLFRQAEAAQQLSNTFRSSLAKSGAGRIDIEHVMRTRSRAGAAVRDLYIDEFESSGDEQQNSLAPEFEYDSDDQLRKNVKRLVRDYVDISDDDDEFCSDEDETSMSKTARTTGDAESLADSKAETVPYQASKNFNFGSSCNASIIGSQRPRSAASYHRMGVREVRKLQALSYYKQMLLCPMQKRGMYKRRRLKKTDRFMGSESFQRLASGVRSLVRDKNKKQGSSPNKDDAAAWNRAGGPLGLPTRLTKGSFLGSRGIAETQQNRIDQQNNATWWQIARGQVSLDSLHQSGVSVSDPSKLDEVLRETFQQQQLAKPGENKIKGSYPNAGGINKDNISSLPLDGTDATGQHLYGMCDVESPLYLNSQGGLEPPPGAGGASGQQHQQQHQHQAGVENAVLAAARKRRALQTPNTPYRASPWGSLPSALSPMDQMHQQATGNGMSPALREIAETGQGVSPGGAQGRLRDIASRSGKVMLTRNRKSGNMQIHRLGSAGNAIPIGATTGNSFHEVGGGPAFPNSTGGGAGSSSGACWPQGPSTSPLVTEGGTMLGLGNFEDAINTRRLVCSGNQTKSITGSATASGSNSVTVEGALERGGGRRNSHSSSGNRGGDDSRSPGVSLVEQMGAEQSTEVSVSSSTSNSPAKNALSPNTRSPNRAAHKRGIFVHQGSPAKMASKRRYSSGLHKSPAPAAGKESSTLVQHAEVEQHNPNYSTGDDKATSRSTTAAPTSSSASAVGDSSELQQQVYPETEAARFAGWTKTDEAAQPQECPAAVVAGPNEDRVGEKKTQDEQHREGGAPDYQKSDTRNAAHQLTQDMSQSVSVIVGETAMVVDNMQASHKTTEEPSAASSFFRNDSEDLYTNTTTSSSSTGGANHKSQKHQIAASKHLQPAAVTLDAVETSTVLKPHLFDGHQTGETSTALKPHLFDGSRPVGRRKGRDKVAQQTPGGELNSGFSSEVEFCSSELRTQSEGDQMKVTSTTTGSGGRNTTNAGPGDGPSAASFSSSRCTSSGVSGGLQPGVVEGGARVTRSSSHSKNGRAGGGSKFLDYLQTKRSTAAKLVSESIHSLSNKNGIHDPEERAGAAYAVGSDMGSDGGYHNADNTLNAEVENRGAALSGSSVEGSTHLDAGRSTDLDTAAIELLHTGHLGAGVQQQGSSSSSSRVFRGEVGFDIAVDDFPKSAAHQLRANIMHSPDEDRGEHDDEDAIGSVSSIAAGASSSVLHSMNTRLGERMQSLRSQFSEPRRSERSVLGSSLKKTASRHYSGAPGGGSPSKRNFY
ncbi:unnamed protein product [Amoebophrya sp. A25]|nr:unnamed protein product [Amoebophrya sp. A25]|eukprot:GSA25T00000309001.1